MPPRLKYEEPKPGPTEIRIHGVGGTGPDVMLDEPNQAKVAGDDGKGSQAQTRRKGPGRARERALKSRRTSGAGLPRASLPRIWYSLPFTARKRGWMVVRSTARRQFGRMQVVSAG